MQRAILLGFSLVVVVGEVPQQLRRPVAHPLLVGPAEDPDELLDIAVAFEFVEAHTRR